MSEPAPPGRGARSARAAVPPFYAMEAARKANARAAAGEDLVRFDVGQPGWPAPAAALAGAEQALRSEALGYTDALGSPALRRAIARLYVERHGLEIAPGCIAVTTGASGAFVLAFLALFDTGAKVAMASPGYPPYRHILTALGMEAVCLEASAAERFQLTPALLEKAAGPIHGVLAASPANPTGASQSSAALRALTAWAHAEGAWLISDEIYHGLAYGASVETALAFDPDAIVINSFSKYWGMTGWRVGWLVAPERLMGAIERLAQNLFICPPAVAQAAALAALTATEECEARRSIYAANRALLLRELPGLGLPPVVEPDGAFYVLIDLARTGLDGQAFAQRALEAGVALTPGIDFEERRGAGWARISYPLPTEQVERGLERLARLGFG